MIKGDLKQRVAAHRLDGNDHAVSECTVADTVSGRIIRQGNGGLCRCDRCTRLCRSGGDITCTHDLRTVKRRVGCGRGREAAALDNIAVEQLLRHLVDEAGGMSVLRAAVQQTALGAGEVQLLLRARHSDIAQTALLLHVLLLFHRAEAGEQAVLHAGEEHDRELEGGDKPIQAGEFVTMDFGCKYGGYCSDMTRTVAVGYATDEMKHVYDTVLKAQLTAIAATKAGVPGKDIDGTARKVIADAGYGEYFGHGYGHSLGLEIHENPSPNASNTEPLPAGVVCSAEPGIYLPGKFGVRIEDVTIITEEGCEDITGSPKNLIII